MPPEIRSTPVAAIPWDCFSYYCGIWGAWSGVAPDGSVLTVRDVSSHEISALELQLP
jgi:hypothetical protein